jgi:predicted amidohydrolase YtcJ
VGTFARVARVDLTVLSEDYFSVPEQRIPLIKSELTVVGGTIVHSTGALS